MENRCCRLALARSAWLLWLLGRKYCVLQTETSNSIAANRSTRSRRRSWKWLKLTGRRLCGNEYCRCIGLLRLRHAKPLPGSNVTRMRFASKFLLGILHSIAARVKQRERRGSHFRESHSNWQTMSGEGGGACVFLAGTDASRIVIEPLRACSLILYLQFPRATDLESIILTTIRFLRCLFRFQLRVAGVCEGVQVCC